MPKAGLEPARGCPHKILSLARLPISSLRRLLFSYQVLCFCDEIGSLNLSFSALSWLPCLAQAFARSVQFITSAFII